MSKKTSWNGISHYEFQPIVPRNDNDSEENKLFWSASPSGEMEMMFSSGADPEYDVGAYYYVDLTPIDFGEAPEGATIWHLESVLDYGAQKEFKFKAANSHYTWRSFFKVQVDTQTTKAADCMGLPTVAKTPEGRQAPLPWLLELSFAEASDG
jgi:hypothetical protein